VSADSGDCAAGLGATTREITSTNVDAAPEATTAPQQRQEQEQTKDTDEANANFAEARQKLAEVQAIFRARKADLAEWRCWQYQSAISPGVQEYIEALSFLHYLEHGSLISYDDVQRTFCDEDGALLFRLTLDDYLLGVSDLTGELMRFAITSISRRNGRKKAREVSDFVRNCKADFEGFTPFVRQLSKKQEVTSQSLIKIEEAAYAIALRTSEYAGYEDVLEDIVERCVSEVMKGPTVPLEESDYE